MKKLTLALIVLAFVSVSALAQGKKIMDRETVEHRHDDGSVTIEMYDARGTLQKVVIDPPLETPLPENPLLDPESEYFQGLVPDETEIFGNHAKMAVTIPVYAIADEEYRAQYSNWQSNLNQIIETADNAYYRDFGINWVIQGYYSWTSNGSSSSAILADLASDGSGLPDGLAMGFTRDSSFTAGGIAYVYSFNPGTGFSVCKDQGISSTTYALRHEAGHNYGASHDFDPVVCLMNYTYSYSIDYFDSAHNNMINSRTNWF